MAKVRYIRDYLNGNNENAGNHWAEIQAFNSSGVNVAVGATVTASTIYTAGEPSYVTDGDTTMTNLYELEFGASVYLTVDLGAVHDIESINRLHYNLGDRFYNGTKTEVSLDGNIWYTVFDSAVSGTYIEPANGRSDPVLAYSFPHHGLLLF